MLGWTLCLLLEEHRGTQQNITEYVEETTLVLLLCGLRLLLQSVVGAVTNHSNATVRQAFLPAVQLGLERETRAPRRLARDAATWAQAYFDEPEKVLSFEEAREHVRWTSAYFQVQEATSDQEGNEEVWRVGEEEMKDLVRVDMLFAARRRELLGTISEVDIKSGSKLAGEIAAEASR